MSIGNKGTTPAPVFCNQAKLVQPVVALSSPFFSIASQFACRSHLFARPMRCFLPHQAAQRQSHPIFPAEIPVPERAVSAHLAAFPIHNIALARKRGVMNHYRPLVAPAMFLAS